MNKKKEKYYFSCGYAILEICLNEQGEITSVCEIIEKNVRKAFFKKSISGEMVLSTDCLKSVFELILGNAVSRGDCEWKRVNEFFSKLKGTEKDAALETIKKVEQKFINLEFDVRNDELFKSFKEKNKNS